MLERRRHPPPRRPAPPGNLRGRFEAYALLSSLHISYSAEEALFPDASLALEHDLAADNRVVHLRRRDLVVRNRQDVLRQRFDIAEHSRFNMAVRFSSIAA